MHIFFVCLPSFHSHPSQCPPPTKRPMHPHRFSQQSEPFRVSTRGLSQAKFVQQRCLMSLWLPWAIFGLPRCSPKDPWTLDWQGKFPSKSQFAERMWRHSLLMPPGKKTNNMLACVFTVANVLGTWERYHRPLLIYRCMYVYMSFFQRCPDGYYSGAVASSCLLCGAGKKCFDGSNYVTPTDCDPGYYSKLGQTTCSACSAGNPEIHHSLHLKQNQLERNSLIEFGSKNNLVGLLLPHEVRPGEKPLEQTNRK